MTLHPQFPGTHDLALHDAVSALTRGRGKRALVWFTTLSLLAAMAIVAGVVAWDLTSGTENACPEPAQCRQPPGAPPLGPAMPYTSGTYGYSLDAAPGCSYFPMPVTNSNADGISWQIQYADLGWPVSMVGQKTEGRSAREITEQIQREQYPTAEYAYSIPMAELGYHPGYGAVYDYQIPGATSGVKARAIIMAATDGDLAIVVRFTGLYEPTDNYSHANPAGTWAVFCVAKPANSVVWPGEPQH